ncbi:hypothetical protein [Sulfurospirillum arsenophilum]|uniref:hypothetical protein n=1 Tax=Sulfurospirillum arsenophilum TaxID=56698 RepID=UPI0005A64AFB|nr:hypothetical protein [Sulfurospirillum arsenophilum]
MKLVFFKEAGQIKVKLNNNGTDMTFDYIKFIEYLYDNNELEETEFDNTISRNEQEKIMEMIAKINETVVRNDTKTLE